MPIRLILVLLAALPLFIGGCRQDYCGTPEPFEGESSEDNDAPPGQQTAPVPVATFEKGDKYGFIDRHGEVAIEPKYDRAHDFSEGLAFVREGKQAAFIDQQSRIKVLLPFGVTDARRFSEGLAWFKDDKRKWGLCDAKGAIVIRPKYDDVLDFSGGLAAANLGATIGFRPVMEGGKWGYIDTRGEVVVPVQFETANSFSEGLARVTQNKETRFIDKIGKTIVNVGRTHAGDFREGLMPVYVDKYDRWHTDFIDRSGKKQFSVEGYAREFHDGLAATSVKQQSGPDLYGYVDRKGKIAIEAKFIDAYDFSEGFAAVTQKKLAEWKNGEEWGYIDKTGAFKIAAKFNEAREFRNGLAVVHIGGTREMARHVGPYWTSGEWWLIDRDGRKLVRRWW